MLLSRYALNKLVLGQRPVMSNVTLDQFPGSRSLPLPHANFDEFDYGSM